MVTYPLVLLGGLNKLPTWMTSMVYIGKRMVDLVTMTEKGKKALGEENFCISAMANR